MLNLDNLKNAAPIGCKSARMSSVLFPIINKQNKKGQKEPDNIILLTGRETSREIQFDVNIIYFALYYNFDDILTYTGLQYFEPNFFFHELHC